jgi:hypothetical protein
MSRDARLTLAAPVSLGVLLALVIGARREHTVWGEVLSAAVMASLALPAAAASDVPALAARTCAAIFAGGYASATLAVHAVIARTRRPPAVRARAAATLGALVVLALFVAAAVTGVLHPAGVIAVMPMAAGSIALACAAPPARQLQTVGWTLVGVSTLAALITISAFRQ